jgi:hypothetical protein
MLLLLPLAALMPLNAEAQELVMVQETKRFWYMIDQNSLEKKGDLVQYWLWVTNKQRLPPDQLKQVQFLVTLNCKTGIEKAGRAKLYATSGQLIQDITATKELTSLFPSLELPESHPSRRFACSNSIPPTDFRML